MDLRCRSETWCTRLAEDAGRKTVAKNRHLGTIAQVFRAIFSQLRHVSTIGKNLLSSNMSSRCPHNMVNFGPLAAEIDPVVWSTPANFNGFRVLAALLNRGHHLCSAGRPSHWALAHILVFLSSQSRPMYPSDQCCLIVPHASLSLAVFHYHVRNNACKMYVFCLSVAMKLLYQLK